MSISKETVSLSVLARLAERRDLLLALAAFAFLGWLTINARAEGDLTSPASVGVLEPLFSVK